MSEVEHIIRLSQLSDRLVKFLKREQRLNDYTDRDITVVLQILLRQLNHRG